MFHPRVRLVPASVPIPARGDIARTICPHCLHSEGFSRRVGATIRAGSEVYLRRTSHADILPFYSRENAAHLLLNGSCGDFLFPRRGSHSYRRGTRAFGVFRASKKLSESVSLHKNPEKMLKLYRTIQPPCPLFDGACFQRTYSYAFDSRETTQSERHVSSVVTPENGR